MPTPKKEKVLVLGPVLGPVLVFMDMIKHHDEKQFGEEEVDLIL